MISRRRKIKKSQSNNRLKIILAIIFLLSMAIIFRLFNLQVWQYDLYQALASDQHQVLNKLAPERGKIYVQDKAEGGRQELYPVATSKDYALLYAIPKDVEDPQGTAEKLYAILDQARIGMEVDEELNKDEYFNLPAEEMSPAGTASMEEFRKIKRELEIKLREEQVIADYVKKLSKFNDPYEPIMGKVDESERQAVMDLNITGIDYIMERHRYYPEKNIGSHMIGFVGNDGEERRGQYGLEGFFDEELKGLFGIMRVERAADRSITIINDREYKKELDGSDLVLTINRSIQYFACSKLNEAVLRHGADGGSVVIMEPQTGALIAMCSSPDYDPNNYNEAEDINIFNNSVIFEQYEPGSIFKVFTMAAGIDQGKITPSTTYVDNGYVMVEGWPKPIQNSDYTSFGGHGQVDMVTVLTESLNTGSIFVMEKTGAEVFADYVERFGFGEKTGIELETEGTTNIINLQRSRIRPVEAATASFGQGITATPLQLITAFAALVNGGIIMKPFLVSEIVSPTGDSQKTQPQQIRRVISEKTSLLLSGMMVNVVDRGHSKLAKVEGYYVGGKTGTAQIADKEKGGYQENAFIHTFVGFAPVEEPKFVILTKLDNPKDVNFAASSAAPLFSEIAAFILNYYQVPKER